MKRTHIVIAALLVIAFVVAVRVLPVAEWITQFQAWARAAGPVGYVAYVVVYVLCCVLIIPAVALSLGAGAIFGFAIGSVVVLIGATLGATAAFLLARTVLRTRVERMTANNAKFRALDRAITTEGTKILWLVRLSGFPPFTWVNYAFGLTGVRLGPYVLITFLGIIPGTLAFTYAGAAGAAALTGSGNRIALIVTAVGAVVVAVFVGRIALKAIRRAGVDVSS
ncbi:MAG TPA: VTT domain-containing protein [Thermoanaerobaculia bacterium]|nr:VTT domain-containing protein [Thermoanaerobaculia bacterium]